MDHKYIEQFDLVDRYLMGRLAAEESARFEEHFVGCSHCTDRLAVTKEFVQDLRFVAAQQASEARSYIPPRARWYLPRSSSPRPLALAASILLLALIAGGIFALDQMRRLRSEAEQAKNASSQWERRYEEERQASDESARERREMEQQLTGQLHDLEDRLQRAQKQSALKEDDFKNGVGIAEPGGGPGSGVKLLIFPLSSVRGVEQPSSAPTNKIALPRTPVYFAITLGLESETGCKDYQMTIFDAGDRPVWRSGGFKPDATNSLSASFNSSFFRPGNYLLTVNCLTDEGGSRPVGNYPFSITKDLP